MLIRFRRTQLSMLPRPASEIGAEVTDDGLLRIWIHGSSGTRIAVTELSSHTPTDIQRWLIGRREFARDATAWRLASQRAATAISQWFGDAKEGIAE